MQNNKPTEIIDETKSNEQEPAPEERTEEMVPRQDLDNVVNELKEVRKGRAHYKELYEKSIAGEEPEGEPTKPADGNDVTAAVTAALEKRDAEQAKKDRESAFLNSIEKFKNSYKTFNQENDEDGTKFSVIEKELEQFNLSSAKTEEDFLGFMKKAATIAGIQLESQDDPNPSVTTPTNVQVPGNTPAPSNDTGSGVVLTDGEKAAAAAANISEARMLELKTNRPKTFNNVMGYSS